MTDMPEKIYAIDTLEEQMWSDLPWNYDCGTCYIREDVSEARIAAARKEALEEAAEKADERHYTWIYGKGRNPADYISPYSIIAAAEARRSRIRSAATGASASSGKAEKGEG